MNLLYKLIAITLIVGFTAVAIKNINTTNQRLQIKGIELKSNEAKLLELNQKYDQVLKEKADTKAEKEKQAEQIKELEAEKSRLERELSVKRENIRLEQEKLSKVAKKASGTQVALASNYEVTQYIINAANRHGVDPNYLLRVAKCESGHNPNAVNRNYYAGGGNPTGLFQYLPETWNRIGSRSPYGVGNIWNALDQANVTAWAFANGYAKEWECS